MRKFIVSDLHANGDVYDSIMGYLEHISQKEDVELFINGDLIDKGLDGFRMITDVKKRDENPHSIKVHYLAGNREWLMYDSLQKREVGKPIDSWCDWFMNGGWQLGYEIEDQENAEELSEGFKHYLGELKIYHVFDEKIQGRPMVLVHAQTPEGVKTGADMRIADQTIDVEKALWTRKKQAYSGLFGFVPPMKEKNRIGLDGYFSIVGHTPVESPNGFEIDPDENSINIDGGCSFYAQGKFQYDHVPVVEVKKDHIDLIIFNHDNEIMNGFHYDGELTPMREEELQEHRSYLCHDYDHQAEKYKEKILEMINL